MTAHSGVSIARASVGRLTSHHHVSLPGLKSSIELESGPTGPQLIDRQTGQRLPLSQTEAQLLGLWDGVQTATALSARLFVEGLDVEPWQVEQFFARLAKAQVLSATAPVVPDFIPAGAGVEELSDLVPTLRGDLIITKSTTSKGTLEVKDPLTERSFTLYDFEVSIARMLDGKRSAADVLAAANRLGIPVTLPTLKTFLQQLKAYQFIDLAAAGAGESTWPKRRQWTVGVRELYQSAIRLMRAGKYDEARGYADAMVEADPGNEDAVALQQRIDAESAGSFELAVPFDTLHTPLSSPAITRVPEAAAAAVPDPFASFGFHGAEPPAAAELPPIPQEVSAPVPARSPVGRNRASESSEEPVLAPRRSKAPLFVMLALVVVVLGALLRPVEAMIELPCELQVDELGTPRAPRAGTVGKPEVAAGARVEKGAVLARMTLPPEESPEALDAKIKELEAKLAASHPAATKKELARAQATVKKANAALTALVKKKKKTPKKQLPALEKKIEQKQAALDKAKAALEVAQQPDERAELKRSMEELTSKKVNAAVLAERSMITAPATGLFLPPDAAPEKVAENDAWGRIVGTTFRAVTTTPLVTDAQTAVFSGPAGRLDVKLDKTAAGVTARVEGQLKWVGAKGTLEVASGRTPWLLSALR